MGIHISRWITSHGFALNIAPELDFFRAMRPCGLDGDQVTTLEKVLGHSVERARVEGAIIEAVQTVWETDIVVEELADL